MSVSDLSRRGQGWIPGVDYLRWWMMERTDNAIRELLLASWDDMAAQEHCQSLRPESWECGTGESAGIPTCSECC